MHKLVAPILTALLCLQPNGHLFASEAALRLNEIQVLGSHNSYKLAMDPALMSALAAREPGLAATLDYSHIGLRAQLELGIRKLELDLYYDPQGGRYQSPSGIDLVVQQGLAASAFDPMGEMREPGFKVLHIQDLDFRSHCLTLKSCLVEVKAFSDAFPDHWPIVISFNAKSEKIEGEQFVEPLPFTAAVFDELDRDLVSLLGKDRVITPDEVRAGAETLNHAIRTRGWPSLAATRGRFLLVLDEGGEKQAAYVAGHPSLTGRMMFVNAPAGTAEAAFLVINDPVAQANLIRERVREGYLVRTRADADTHEARSNDRRRLRAAIDSGAHFISTDYYQADPRWPDYWVRLTADRFQSCNPVSAKHCVANPATGL